MWCPPTPPQDDNDVYIDHSIGFLYEQTVMSESQLPPIYVKKEQKRLRLDNSPANERESRRPLKMRHREESMFAPRSLFDRPTPAIIKMRRDMKLQKYRGIVRNPLSIPGVKPPLPTKQLPDQDTAPEWLIHEDWALLQAIQEYLDLPLNLTVLSPAHTPNWDFVADIVNNVSRTFRSAKQCRNRYEAVIIPREEGRLLYDVSPKKPKKNKNVGKPPPQTKTNRSMRTSQLYLQDNHGMYTRLYSHRFETIKSIANKKQSTTKPTIINTLRSTKHSTILAENGINYEVPLTPLDVAIKRAERIAKEKQKVVQAQLLSEQRRLQLQQLQQQQQSKQQMQQQLQQQQAQQQQQTAQAKGTLPTTTQQVSLGSVVTAPAASSSTAQAVVVGINPSQELLGANQVRAVTSSSGSLVTVASLNSAQVQVAAQRLATVSLPSQTQTVPVSTPTKAGGTMTATKPMSVQILRHMRQPGQHPHLHQQQLQQQQQQQQQQHRLASHQQLKVLQAAQAAGQGVTAGQKVSVAMTSGTVGGVAAVQVSQATAQRVQQFMNMKQAAAAAASAGTVKQTVSRTVTDSEMTAIIKRQQQQQLVAAQQKSQLQVASQPTLSQAQAHLLAQMQAGSSGQTQVATLVKAVSTPGGTTQSVTIPVTGMTLPQMKATFSPGAKGASPQQIRQLALHPQILQQRKLPMQKVAQLTQVTGKGGVPAQLIVQSPKAMPTTVTVQQIQQVIKQVPPQTVQHITHVSGGQAVVSQPSGSQMISHAVLTKGSQVPGAAQTLQTRVIPMSGNQQGLKQTIQVVTAGPGGRTSVPNVTIDSSGRPTVSVASTLASALAGTIKVTPSPAQQQAILSQVSAALQGQHVQQIRQPGSSPMRIQAVAVQQQGQALPAVIAQPTTSQTSSSQENQQ